MRLWKTFLKRNGLWLSFIFLLILVQEFYFYLIGASWHEYIYAAVIEVFLLLVTTMLDFLHYRRRVRELQQAKARPAEEPELPEAADAIEEEYQELLENANIERRLEAGRAGRQQQEMEEYYELWVHQVKTPISAMQLLLQLQKKEPGEATEGQDEFLSDLEEELFHIEQYTGMALSYQRLQAPAADFILKKIKLDTVIREAIRKYAKIMIRRRIPVHYAGTMQTAMTDEKWLEFVMEQVLSNAVKYTREGSISIEVVSETNWCYIVVRDQGIGIRQEDIPRVFEKGYTGYNGHSDKRSSGIGLYLCKTVLVRLGHTIRLESGPGEGTTVWIGLSQKETDVRD